MICRRFCTSLVVLMSLLIDLHLACAQQNGHKLPIVINTWAFTSATQQAWDTLNKRKGKTAALDAVEQGCAICEREQCDGTVGFGGSPDEEGETTLDALIMDGNSMEVGAVASLRHVKQAIATARMVMDHTLHSLLAGLQATQFANEMGVPVEDLTTKHSTNMHKEWVEGHCQPNFRRRVVPDPCSSCGPYSPLTHPLPVPGVGLSDATASPMTQRQALHAQHDSVAPEGGEGGYSRLQERGARQQQGNKFEGGEEQGLHHSRASRSSAHSSRSGGSGCDLDQPGSTHGGLQQRVLARSIESNGGGGTEVGGGHTGSGQTGSSWPSHHSHDTIAMAAIDGDGTIAAGCSTNGARNKVPGRVGDCSVAGGGAYADSEVGACGATGDGDVHLRFLPCYQVVESMRRGMKPQDAVEDAIKRMARRVPGYVGAVFAVDKEGSHGGACHGWDFQYAFRDGRSEAVEVVEVKPLSLDALDGSGKELSYQG